LLEIRSSNCLIRADIAWRIDRLASRRGTAYSVTQRTAVEGNRHAL
jgi:hypothetical protein